jgi:AraC-like DNA-binding protein
VGYKSEPAFNRAFKREFGLPPARFRTRIKSVQGTARIEKAQLISRDAAGAKNGAL